MQTWLKVEGILIHFLATYGVYRIVADLIAWRAS